MKGNIKKENEIKIHYLTKQEKKNTPLAFCKCHSSCFCPTKLRFLHISIHDLTVCIDEFSFHYTDL